MPSTCALLRFEDTFLCLLVLSGAAALIDTHSKETEKQPRKSPISPRRVYFDQEDTQEHATLPAMNDQTG